MERGLEDTMACGPCYIIFNHSTKSLLRTHAAGKLTAVTEEINISAKIGTVLSSFCMLKMHQYDEKLIDYATRT